MGVRQRDQKALSCSFHFYYLLTRIIPQLQPPAKVKKFLFSSIHCKHCLLCQCFHTFISKTYVDIWRHCSLKYSCPTHNGSCPGWSVSQTARGVYYISWRVAIPFFQILVHEDCYYADCHFICENANIRCSSLQYITAYGRGRSDYDNSQVTGITMPTAHYAEIKALWGRM